MASFVGRVPPAVVPLQNLNVVHSDRLRSEYWGLGEFYATKSTGNRALALVAQGQGSRTFTHRSERGALLTLPIGAPPRPTGRTAVLSLLVPAARHFEERHPIKLAATDRCSMHLRRQF